MLASHPFFELYRNANPAGMRGVCHNATFVKMLSKGDSEQDFNIDELGAELWNACMSMSSKSSKSRASLEFEALWKTIHIKKRELKSLVVLPCQAGLPY